MKLEIYKDEKKEWRWTVKAANGRIIADSGEGYKNRLDCLHGFDLLASMFVEKEDDDEN